MAKVDVGDAAPDFELPGHRAARPTGSPTTAAASVSSPSTPATPPPSAPSSSAPTATRASSSTSSTPRCSGSRRSRSSRTSASPRSKSLNVPLLADEDKAVAKRLRRRSPGRWCGGRSSSSTSEGIVRHRKVTLAGAHLPVGRRPRAGASPRSADGRRRAGAVRRRRGAGDPRRGGGGGAADRPLPRDHRHPPLRRPRLAGAGARRPRGRSPTTPAATASPTPPRRGRVMDTRSWSATSRRSSQAQVGEGRVRARRPLDGRPHRRRLRAAPPRARSPAWS